MSDFAKSMPSETEDGSPGPFEKNIPSGLFDRTSFVEEREGRTKTSQPWDTSLFRIEFLIPKSIATILNFFGDSEYLFLTSKFVSLMLERC